MMKNKAISSPSDEFAVVFFGTEKTKNESTFEHIFVVQKLQKPSADLIGEIKTIAESHDFAAQFGHNSHYSLADVFSIALSQFTNRSAL